MRPTTSGNVTDGQHACNQLSGDQDFLRDAPLDLVARVADDVLRRLAVVFDLVDVAVFLAGDLGFALRLGAFAAVARVLLPLPSSASRRFASA